MGYWLNKTEKSDTSRGPNTETPKSDTDHLCFSDLNHASQHRAADILIRHPQLVCISHSSNLIASFTDGKAASANLKWLISHL